jgi:CO dehydrogenase/acetyl-CoA synthase alpha subunit
MYTRKEITLPIEEGQLTVGIPQKTYPHVPVMGGELILPQQQHSVKVFADVMGELMQIPEAREVLIRYGAKWK